MDGSEQAGASPGAEAVVDAGPRGEAVWQRSPLAPRLDDVEERIEHAARAVASELYAVEERRDSFPLGVRQVGAEASLAHGLSCEGGTRKILAVA